MSSMISCRRVGVTRDNLLRLGGRPDDLALGIQEAQGRRPIRPQGQDDPRLLLSVAQAQSIVQRKVLTPNDVADLDAIRLRLALAAEVVVVESSDSLWAPKPLARHSAVNLSAQD